MRWYFAVTGVRRSNIRRCESLETQEMIDGFEGQKVALYTQLSAPMDRVLIELVRVGDH